MNKVREAIEALGYEDLVSIQKDILTGSSRIKALVADKLRQIEEEETRICATCGGNINVKTAENFTLVFGPPDLKKRAHFCALDCMTYFLTSLKRLTEKKAKANI
jgi:hypothetical protein